MPRGHGGGRPKSLTKEERIAKGTFHSGDYIEDVEVDDDVLVMPKWLHEEARMYFDYVVETLEPLGLNSKTFSMAASLLAEAMCDRDYLRTKARETGGPVIPSGAGTLKANPAYKSYVEADKKVLILLTEFGLTPVTAGRVNAKRKEKVEESPFAQFN